MYNLHTVCFARDALIGIFAMPISTCG